MNPAPLSARDTERLSWMTVSDHPVETDDGRVIVENHQEFSHFGKYDAYKIVVVRFKDDPQFYGYLQPVDLRDDDWVFSEVELRPVVRVMKPSWEWAEEPVQ